MGKITRENEKVTINLGLIFMKQDPPANRVWENSKWLGTDSSMEKTRDVYTGQKDYQDNASYGHKVQL